MTSSLGKKKPAESKQPGAAAHPKQKIHAYWPPWTAGPLVLVLGELAHHFWGRTLPSAGVVPLVLVLSTVGLSALTHRYASPRNNVQQWHAVLSVAVLGLSVVLVELFGTGLSVWPVRGPNVLGQAVLFLSAVLALSWNIRRFEVIRGTGDDKHGQDSAEEDWHGLKKPRSLKVTATDGKKTQAKVKLAAGQTAKDVEAAIGAMGSDLGTITSGIRIEKGTREGEVDLTLLWEDQLTDAVGWEGPSHVGGSIADPISLGVNEQQKNVILRLAGDYDEGVAPGHVTFVGMPRTGKGIGVVVVWTNLRGRRDVFPVINDAAKGEQMLMFLRPGMPKGKAWIDKTESGAKVQANAIKRAIKARNKALGDAGFSSWTPEAYSKGLEWNGRHIHMPAIVFHIEEFAPIGIASPNLFTEIAEQALSAGIFLMLSLQRASHDRFPTSLRSLIGNGVCYGSFSDIDVSFALPDSATEGGATPADWKQKFPGRAMASLNGQPDGMERIPLKTHYAASKEEFEAYVKETMGYLGRLAPDLDPCTAEAFGQPYLDYLAEDEARSKAPEARSKPADAVPTPDEDDQPATGEPSDEDMDDDDPNATEYVKRPMPEDLNADHIDPYRPLPEWEGPDVDLTPPPSPGYWRPGHNPTLQEKRTLFREILQRLADSGELDVTTGRLIELWTEALGNPRAKQAATVGRFIVDAAAEDLVDGKPNDLLGCLERGKRGNFRITIRPRVAAMNGHRP